jgi:hypothetical protein
LLLGLLVGCLVDLKITLFEGLVRHSTLLLMVATNFFTDNFLAIRWMSLLSELFRKKIYEIFLKCNSWGTVSSPPSPPPPILLIPFNKSCFVEP